MLLSQRGTATPLLLNFNNCTISYFRSTQTVASDESTSPTGSTRRRSFRLSLSSTCPSRTRASNNTNSCSRSATTRRWVKWRHLARDSRIKRLNQRRFNFSRLNPFRRLIQSHQQETTFDTNSTLWCPRWNLTLLKKDCPLLIQNFLMSFQHFAMMSMRHHKTSYS